MTLEAKRLLDEARALLPQAVALRRRIHAHPEIGNDLPETTAAVLESLADLDLEIRRGERTTSFVASLRGGRPGPSLLLRADMDALPMPEDTGLEYASRIENRMHACGHDAHTAMLATAARLLARHRDALPGEVRFFFQTGEEGWFGARQSLDEGLLDANGAPDAVFAIHVDPRIPVGRVVSRAGPVLAATDEFSIDVRGRGGHASMPHDAIDPIPVACEMVQAFQGLVTRRIDAFDPVVLSVTKIRAGTANNVIPESANLVGTLRSVSEAARERARAGVSRVARGVAAAHDCEVVEHWIEGYPVTVNDAGFLALARDAATELLGERGFAEMPAPVMGAEDFSFLLQRWPGAMVFLGVRPEGVRPVAPCHSNRMRLDEDGMAAGIALHAVIALRFLESRPAAG